MLCAMSEAHQVDSRNLPWRPTPHPGVRWKKLHFDADSGHSAVLLHFAPGASYGAHRHPAGEQYLVLAGSIRDGDASWSRGAYLNHPPGSVHRPHSDEGCLLYVTLPAPIEPIDTGDA